MKRTAVLNVVALSQSLIGEHTPNIVRFQKEGCSSLIEPAFPAVTCTAQADYLTGVRPNQHGVVGNGWYDRTYSETRFWKQSNHLVGYQKLWDELKEKDASFTCAKLFWWFNMYASVDYSITPRPVYLADGGKVFDIYTSPMEDRFAIQEDLGGFPFMNFWGPFAGIKSSRWIANAAKWIEDKYHPTLSLVYLPHLDYNLQRYGPHDERVHKDLQEIDEVVGGLIDFYAARGIQVVLLSEYGISPVEEPVHINRILRQQGWLTLKKDLGLEYLDCGASQAFAISDHQVAHVYVNNDSIKDQVKACLENQEGIAEVLDRSDMVRMGLDHERSGDLIAVSGKRAWFTYYYWEDDRVAPDFATSVDIHRKVGYDPVELFIDPKLKVPGFKIAGFLLKKKLGFRGLLKVIPLDASLVRGSHGAIPDDKDYHPVMISQRECVGLERPSIGSTEVYEVLREHLL